jgi:ABC-type multidrug transport system fused ATPase/permease subunit
MFIGCMMIAYVGFSFALIPLLSIESGSFMFLGCHDGKANDWKFYSVYHLPQSSELIKMRHSCRVVLMNCQKLYGPLSNLGQLYRVFQQNLVDTENLLKLLKEPQEIQDKPDAQDFKFEGEIEFENVSFSYDGKVQALKDISFKIPAGKSVALVGESGKLFTTSLVCEFPRPD